MAAGHLGRKSGRGVYDYATALPLAPFVIGDRAPSILLAASDPAMLAPLVDQALSLIHI